MVKKKSAKKSHETHSNSHTHAKKKNTSLLDSMKNNYWAVATIVLAIILLVVLVSPSSCITGNVIAPETAGQKVIDFAKAQGAEAELVSVTEEDSLYQVVLNIDGQEVPVYVTKDGSNLVPSLIPLEISEETQKPAPTPAPQQPAQTTYSEEDLTKINEFAQCLNENGFVIYGANWCGYTKQVVALFGGFESVDPVYVECTEEEELCQSEGIRGYPTIKVNGEAYQGARTFESFAEATGCIAPVVGAQIDTNSDVQC